MSFLRPRRGTLVAFAAVALLPFSALTVRAQSYPDHPINLIVPFPPGGGTDILSRLLANKISSSTGWNFVVDNRPGAGGNIGLTTLSRAEPDGYTLGMGQTSNLAINPTLYPKMPYDVLTAFAPVAMVAEQAEVLVVRKDAPWQTLSDLVAAAKVKPEALTMGSAGTGTVTHLAGEMFGKRAGVDFLHVPYKGGAQAITDVIGGQTDFTFSTPPGALPMIKGDKLRALAVTSLKRLPALPDVPTIAESGYEGFEATDWKALVAPAGTPAEIIERVSAEVKKALNDPDMIQRLHEEGSEPLVGTPQELGQLLNDEYKQWAAIVKESGAKPE
ncbi:MAG: LacI family transcriptional regulator [Microvirga sp.]|nr:LacI family transcriptional regulator [Microvirga sp.]